MEFQNFVTTLLWRFLEERDYSMMAEEGGQLGIGGLLSQYLNDGREGEVA